jgi:hypothetical protein
VKKIKNLFFILFLSVFVDAKEIQNTESQVNIIFKKNEFKKENKKLDLRIKFNNAVLYLEQEKYFKAIQIFKITAKDLKIPSFLNIGIAYYKLNSTNNAYLYLKKLYDLKDLEKKDLYSYVSTSYYLYNITRDRKYISSLMNAIKNSRKEKITENVKLLLANAYIITKEYKKSIKLLKNIIEPNNLKLALLYLKTKNYTQSEIHLQKALTQTQNIQEINKILWFEVYMGLKTNNIAKIKVNIDKINERLDMFKLYPRMPIKIYFNPNKYTSKEYLVKSLDFDEKRKMDMLFYFTPFIFSDDKKIEDESTFAFVFKRQNSIKSLESMLEYNKFFSEIVQKDPITRAFELQKNLDNKFDAKDYEYYNLALAYTHIYSYKKAYKYFNKAYKLNKAHKLYNVLALVSAARADIKIKKTIKTQMLENLLSKDGEYKYIAKNIYKIIFDNKYELNDDLLNIETKSNTYYRFLKFIENKKANILTFESQLVKKDSKDPLVFLFRTLVKQEKESEYDYISRLQDYLPKHYNDYFLKGPYVITEYYIDILKAVGIFNKVDFRIQNDNTPTYLRTKALINLYDGYPVSSIKTIETIQEKYNLNDKNTFDLLIASYLSANDYSNASATLGMLQFELKDKDAEFLNGVQLLQSLKLNSAKLAFLNKYTGRLIDIKLEGLDEYIENL